MITIENDRYLYEVELGVYSYFEDKANQRYFYLSHKFEDTILNAVIHNHARATIKLLETVLREAKRIAYQSRLIKTATA